MANKKKIFDRLENLNIPNNSKNEIFNLIEDVEKDIKTRDEIIDKDIYYNDGSNKVVPVKWPDLSTQPSILPYKFMGQYVYEQLVSATDSGNAYLDIEQLRVSEPIFLSVVAIQKNNYSGNGGRSKIINNKVEFYLDDAPISAPIYYRIVYTSMPEENGGYYYQQDDRTGFLIINQSSYFFDSARLPYITNGSDIIRAVGLYDSWIYVPTNFSMDYPTPYNKIICPMINVNGSFININSILIGGVATYYESFGDGISIDIPQEMFERAKSELIKVEIG